MSRKSPEIIYLRYITFFFHFVPSLDLSYLFHLGERDEEKMKLDMLGYFQAEVKGRDIQVETCSGPLVAS